MSNNCSIQDQLKECIKQYDKVENVAVIERYNFKSKAFAFNNNANNAQEVKVVKNEVDDNQHYDCELIEKSALVMGGEIIYAEDEPEVLSDALKRAASKFPNQTIDYITETGEISTQTYLELLISAERIFTGMRKKNLKPKDNLIFLFDRSDYFINAFWACALGGIVPVPITIPKDLGTINSETSAFIKIWNVLEQATIITSKNVAIKLEQLKQNFDFNTDTIIYIDDMYNEEPDENWYRPQIDDTAIILFTSGSTGLPKGVIQTHKSILARERGTTIFNGFTSEEISVNWMTIEHVASIIMFHVKEVYLGCKQVQVRTQYILNKPLRWLDLLSKYHATITWAPNFAFDLINKNLEQAENPSWDLSSLRVITNAAEAINSKTTKRFLNSLKPYGLVDTSIKPSWGMSETCSCTIYSNNFTSDDNSGIRVLDKDASYGRIKEVSQTDKNSATFVELGATVPGMDMRIADDNNNLVNEGVIGKLQVRGEVVTNGYYRNEEINKSVFVSGGWFETGDMAFIKDGKVTLTGRAKEIIIINGIHYVNSEIEGIVNYINGVQVTYSAACSLLDTDLGRELVFIFFVPSENDIDGIMNTIGEIKKELLQKMSITPDYIIPIKIEEFPRTNIGKIQRSELIKRFSSGYYNEVIKEIEDYTTDDKSTYGFMKEVWVNTPINKTNELSKDKTYILFLNEETKDYGIYEQLESSGCTYIKVCKGDSFEKINNYFYYISSKDVDGYQRLFESIKQDRIQIDAIIHMWNYQNKYNSNNIEELRLKQYESTYSLLYIMKNIDIVDDKKIAFIVVTADSAEVLSNDCIDFEQTAVTGFLKTVAEEKENIKICHLDIKIESYKSCSKYIFDELKAGLQDYYVCYRNEVRYIQKLQTIEIDEENIINNQIKSNGTYIITGGLGGVGYEISKYLLSLYQVNLIILGSSDIKEIEQNNDKLMKLQDLQDYGNVEYYSVDVADYDSFREVVNEIEAKNNEKVSGIFHLAGMNMEYFWDEIEKHSISNEGIKDYEAMFNAKIYGSWIISKIFADYKEFIYVFFSSVNSFFGGNCVGAYSAANSFIDGISKSISNKQNCKCLCWSTWHKTGINKNNAMSVAAEQKGFQSISVKDGIELFDIVMKQNEPHTFIGLDTNNINIYSRLKADKDIEKSYYVFYTASKDNITNKDLYDYVLKQEIDTDININFVKLEALPETSYGHVDYDKLLSMSFENKRRKKKYIEPTTEKEKILYDIWKDILKFDKIGVNTSFFDCGGNSINVHMLVSRISKQFNIELPIIEVYKNNQINTLSSFIEKYESDLN